jgi:outer membrane protein assembly factor BamB
MSGDWLYHLISDVNEGNVSLKSINTSNGIVKWQVNFNYEKISSFSQTNDTLFLVTESGLIFYVDKVTGKIIRKNKLSFTPKLIDLFSDRILISSESSAILFKLDTLEKVFEITLNTSISTILLSSNNLFIGDVKGKLALFDSSTGKKKFEYKTGAKISHLIKTPKGILVTSLDNFFYLFLEDNLKLIWRNKTFSRNILLPKILGDLFIITNLNSNITEIFSLKRKELINRIVIEQDNLFLNEPIFVGNAIIFITLKGIYAFKNRGCI